MTRAILVHGAWHGGWCWSQLVPLLEKGGLDVTTLDLPSAGGGGDLYADAQVVRDAIGSSEEPAVVVGHSYGGAVITEGAAGCEQVGHLVYVCAFQLDVGESLLGVLDHQVPPWIRVDEAAGTSWVPDPVPVFYGDVEPSLAEASAARLAPQSLTSFAQPLTRAAWRDVPSTYLACTEDRAIPHPAQQGMSQRSGTVHTLQSSHSPFLSLPQRVADVVVGLAD